jgi:hypothetical protein
MCIIMQFKRQWRNSMRRVRMQLLAEFIHSVSQLVSMNDRLHEKANNSQVNTQPKYRII